MILRKLSEKELEMVLNNDYISNFPENERKTCKWITDMAKTNNYGCYGMFEQDDLLVFAFCYESESCILLDYFAVCGDRKNQGYGSKALKLLIDKFNNKPILIEVENPEFQKNKELAKKRIYFYTKLGLEKIKLDVNLYGVEFEIMSSKQIDSMVAKEQLLNIYLIMAKFANKKPQITFKFID